MATFPKKNIYFQLINHSLINFANKTAKHNENLLQFNHQINNIRIRPLNLTRNLLISNILHKQRNVLLIKKKDLPSVNFLSIYLLHTINHKFGLSTFLKTYFDISKEVVNIIWSYHLNNTVNTNVNNTKITFNPFVLNKISEICFYQYNNTLLNKHKHNAQLVLNELFINNFWINISLMTHYNQSTSSTKKIVYNYLNNRNVNNTKIKLLNVTNKLNLNNTPNILIKNTANYFLYKPFKNYLKIPNNYLYVLTRIEEKLNELQKSGVSDNNNKKLINFYNFLLEILIQNRFKTLTTDYILGNIDAIAKFKNTNIDIFINKTINKLISVKQKQTINTFFDSFKQKLTNKNFGKQIFSNLNFNKHQQNARLKIAKNFTNKKLELSTNYSKAIYNKKVLSTILKQNTKIFYINALALTKFGFLLEKKNINNQNFSTNPNKFLANLDREMISKYKYVGVYIKDLIRVAFIGLFLKKPAFLAKFIAFQLNVLPKNRKETTFIRFIIKLIKTFAAEREEIWGLRLKFKGRVNRWRRTKVILGQRGILPLHTMHNRIEYGSAQAINRKGAVGVHIWIWYNPIFKNLLKNTYQKYFVYSKYLTYKKQFND